MLCAASRALGLALTGRREMICSIYAHHPLFSAVVDAIFYPLDGLSHHCARMREHEYDRL